MDSYSLLLSRPLGDPDYAPVTTLALDPEIASCQWSDSLPGGYNGMTVTLETQAYGTRLAHLREQSRVGGFYHAQLVALGSEASAVAHWEGRVQAIDYGGPRLTSFVCGGYGVVGLRDAVMQSQANYQVSGRTLLEYALSFCPTIQWQMGDLSGFQDPGVYHNLADLNNQTVEQVIQQLGKLGGLGDARFDFAVWERRRVDFTARVCPVDTGGQYAPDYYQPLDDQRVKLRLDYADCYGGVVARYTDPASGATAYTQLVTDPTFTTRVGFMRTTLIDVGVKPQADAQQLARTYLGWHRFPQVRASLSYRAGDYLQTPAGGFADPRFLRAADWVQLGDDTDLIPPQRVIRCQRDLTGAVTAECGSAAPGADNLIAHLREIGTHTIAGTSPVSGART